MEKSGGQRTNNTFRDIALVPTGRQHPTHPNSKPPALITTLKKNARQSQETKLPRNNDCFGATILKTNCKQDQGVIKFIEIKPLVLTNARQSQVTKIAVKQLPLWSHKTHLYGTKPADFGKNNNESISQTIAAT